MLQQTHDVSIYWRSFELRPAGVVLPASYRERILQSRPRLAQMMWENFGIELKPGPLDINSRQSLIGAKVAEAHGEATGKAYHAAVFRAYWAEGQAIDEEPVLRAVAEKAGMNAGAFMEALKDPVYERQVDMDIALAQQLGIQAVPAMIFEKKYFVSGAQPVDVLREIVDELSAGAEV